VLEDRLVCFEKFACSQGGGGDAEETPDECNLLPPSGHSWASSAVDLVLFPVSYKISPREVVTCSPFALNFGVRDPSSHRGHAGHAS